MQPWFENHALIAKRMNECRGMGDLAGENLWRALAQATSGTDEQRQALKKLNAHFGGPVEETSLVSASAGPSKWATEVHHRRLGRKDRETAGRKLKTARKTETRRLRDYLTAKARTTALEKAAEDPYPHLTAFSKLKGLRANRYHKQHENDLKFEMRLKAEDEREANLEANKPRVVDCRAAVEAHQRKTNPFRRK